MALGKKDLIIPLVVVAAAVVIWAGSGKKLGKDVPADAEHLDFYRQQEQSGNRMILESGCKSCHALDSLPASHPHKEECMVCHRPQ